MVRAGVLFYESAKEPILRGLKSAQSEQELETARTAGLLEVALGRYSEELIVDGLAALADRMTPSQASWAVVEEMRNRGFQAQAWIILATCLDQDEQAPYLTRALDAALDMDDAARAGGLGALGQYRLYSRQTDCALPSQTCWGARRRRNGRPFWSV